MHGFLLNIFLNHSIAIAAFIAAVRFKTIYKDFQAFYLFNLAGIIKRNIKPGIDLYQRI